MIWSLLITVCWALFHHSNGLCTFHALKQDFTEFGTVKKYCEHDIEDPSHIPEEGGPGQMMKFKIVPGSSFETTDCTVCTCTDYGYICCGKGIKSRLFYTPPGCAVKADGCNPVFVLESNHNLDCFTKLPVKQTRLIHKMKALLADRTKAPTEGGTYAGSGESEGTPPQPLTSAPNQLGALSMSPTQYSGLNMPPLQLNGLNGLNMPGNSFPGINPGGINPGFYNPGNGPTGGAQATGGQGGGETESEGGATTTQMPPSNYFPLMHNDLYNKGIHDPFLLGDPKNFYNGPSDPLADLVQYHANSPLYGMHPNLHNQYGGQRGAGVTVAPVED